MSQLSKLFGKTSKGHRSTSPRSKWQPEVEGLETRLQLSTSSIMSNFNGTAIPAGDTVWFSSVMKVSGLGSSPVTVHVSGGEIDFTPKGGSAQAVSVPDANITFDPSATSATTTFDGTAWNTTVPSNAGGNTFLAGAGWAVPTGGLPGGTNPVTWKANFTTDTVGISVNWQWAAAAYTNFSGDYTMLNVKPVDSNSLSCYKNSDHAGTPEAFRSFVVGGARGGGGSNWTGSYSATASVKPDLFTPPPPPPQTAVTPPPPATASLAGSVQGAGTGATVELLDSNGNVIATTLTTDDNGDYQFSNLTAGTYGISVLGTASASDTSAAGSLGGTALTGEITSITVTAGSTGTGYNFLMPNQ
jgi:hypothetical protein